MEPEPGKQEKIVIDANNHLCTDIDGLFDLMRTDDGSFILYENGQKRLVYLLGISREDGSGFSFNVSLYDDSKVREVYVNDFEGRRMAENLERMRSVYRD